MVKAKKKVTKQEAATYQLETAIKLFFENRDLISAYTLCCAADGILEGIYKNNRTEILSRQRERLTNPSNFCFSWREEWEILFKPEYQKEGFRLLNKPQNFLKHADKDPDSTYDFNWDLHGLRILGTVRNYKLVFGKITEAMNIFFIWYAVLNPHLLKKESPISETIAANSDCQNLLKRCPYSKIVRNCLLHT